MNLVVPQLPEQPIAHGDHIRLHRPIERRAESGDVLRHGCTNRFCLVLRPRIRGQDGILLHGNFRVLGLLFADCQTRRQHRDEQCGTLAAVPRCMLRMFLMLKRLVRAHRVPGHAAEAMMLAGFQHH